MYENLIETLRFCAKNGDCHDCPYEKPCAGSMGDGLYCEAADAIEELQRAQELWITQERNALLKSIPRWVSVEDRLPEVNQEVLCACRAGIFEVLKYVNGINGPWYKDSRHVYMSGFVTHWQPLLEPPKEEIE